MPETVGSLLSVNALRADVGKAYATVRAWVQLLELLYFCFLVRPYARRLRRVVRSEPKLYLYDIVHIPKDQTAKRTENLTALHLLKACQYWTDLAYGDFDLRFVRNKDRKELDFLILRDKTPWMAIECKSGQKVPARQLIDFSDQLGVAHRIQLITEPHYDRHHPAHQVRVMGYQSFFSSLV